MRIHLFSICILVSSNICSQALRDPVAAGYIGSGAYSQNHIDAFSFTQNQAALAQIKNGAAGIYGERRFLLAATDLYTAIAVFPTSKGNFGLQADYFGFKNYNESQVGIAYARDVGSRVDIGIKFNYYSFRIPSYGSSSAINFEIGAIAHLSEKLRIGIHAYNPVGGTLSNTDNEKLSSVYKFGIGYEPSESFFISTEIVKEEDQPVNMTAGFQYNFMKRFFVRAGTSTGQANSYAGAGVSWKNFRIDITAAYHSQLGISPGLMMILYFNKKEN